MRRGISDKALADGVYAILYCLQGVYHDGSHRDSMVGGCTRVSSSP